MRAWHLDESPGDYRWGVVDEPVIGPRDVRVDVVASAVNHIDHWLTIGKPRPKAFPHVPGADGAGTVAAVGAEVTDWQLGDEVCIAPAITSEQAVAERGLDAVLDPSMQILGEHRWGTHGEQVVVPAIALVRRPTTRSWEECAAYPTAYVTAYRMLRRARLAAGESLLVTGIGGGVATALFHLGRHLGARVHVTSRDPAKREAALQKGAAGAFDTASPVPVAIDVVADSIGAAVWDTAVAALVPGGRVVTCGGTSGPRLELSLPALFFRQHELIGSTMGSIPEFRAVTDLIAGGLAVDVDGVVGLGDLPEAVERVRSGSQRGKVVIDHRS